jgi:uncharacterized phage-associated protein
MTTATQIADWFLSHVERSSGDAITHLKLQKLVYYGQAWSLANFNKPLFQEELQAWAHGPVATSVWNRHRDAGWEALPAPESCPNLTREQDSILPLVLQEYGKFEAKFLEELTHSELPWKKTRGNLPLQAKCTSIIPKVLMRDFYGKKIKKLWKEDIYRD